MTNTLRLLFKVLFCISISGSAFAQEKLRMATIAPGTSPYFVMATFASSVNLNQDDFEIYVDASGAATDRLLDLARGRLEFSMVAPAIATFMSEGRAMYSDVFDAPELAENVSLLFWFPLGPYHVMTHADSGIETLGDIRGRSVFLGPPGGGAYNTSAAWIKAVTGLQAGIDYIPVDHSWGSAAQAFQQRELDVYINGSLLPFPQVRNFVRESQIKLLGLSRGEANVLVRNIPEANLLLSRNGQYMDVIPAGTYGNGVTNTEDVYTIGVTVGIATRSDLNRNTAYEVTKAFWNNISETREVFPFMQSVTLDKALSNNALKLHPGALQYYEELGLNISDEIR